MAEIPSNDFADPRTVQLPRKILRAVRRGVRRVRADLLRLCLSAANSRGVVVLLYHSVAEPNISRFIAPSNWMDPELFTKEMEFIARRRHALDINTLLQVLDGSYEPKPGSVVLTFDDGYRDTGSFVAPLLESFGLPAVFYLPTRLISRGESPWADRVYSAFRYRVQNRLELPELAAQPFALEHLEQRRIAHRAIISKLIAADVETRTSLVNRVIESLAPTELPPRLLMNWSEVLAVKQRHCGVSFGVHGAEHVDMTTQPEEVVHAEIVACKEEFERTIGGESLHFAYPYDRSDETSRIALRHHAFKSAMASGKHLLQKAPLDPLRIARINAPRDLGSLARWTIGAYADLAELVTSRS